MARVSRILRLPIRPKPHSCQPDIESLSSYLQRLAWANRVSVFSLLSVIHPDSTIQAIHKQAHFVDFRPPTAGLSAFTGVSSVALTAMTFVPAIRTFYDNPLSGRRLAAVLFGGSNGEPMVTRIRRFCGPCLRSFPSFPLLWQIKEVSCCLLHKSALEETCSRCGNRVALLHCFKPAHCAICGFELAQASHRPVSVEMLSRQREIQQNYRTLLHGKVTFAVEPRAWNTHEGFRNRLLYIRWSRRLSRPATVKLADLTRANLIQAERGRRLVSIRSLLKLCRVFTQSLEGFAALPIPPKEWNPPVPKRIAQKCLNRWCADFNSSSSMVMVNPALLCRRCGCRYPRKRRSLFGLPLERFYEALFQFFQNLRPNSSVRSAMTAAGLAVSGYRVGHFRNKLRRVGLLERLNKVWVIKSWEQRELWGYPVTPALLLTRRYSRWTDESEYQSFVAEVQSAVSALRADNTKISRPAIAQQIMLSPFPKERNMNESRVWRRLYEHFPTVTAKAFASHKAAGSQ